MVKAKKFQLLNAFHGVPKVEDFKLVEHELADDLKENEIYCEAVFLTVDPYMRLISHTVPTPCDMYGEQVSRVVRSRNEKFPINTLVISNAGWKSAFISDGSTERPVPFPLGKTSPSALLGVLGMPGGTASIGLDLMTPKSGEILVVNGAGGAVGNIVGQLGKIKGLTVIAFAGTDDKVNYCKNELGFDHVFNYKKIDFSEAVAKVAPDGVDCFFDNVGGDNFNSMMQKHMRKYGRVTCCGSIGSYNDLNPPKYPSVNFGIIGNELRVQGMLASSHLDKFPKALTELNGYLASGQVKVQETVLDGFEKMVEAFLGLFSGKNNGKMIVKA